MHHYQSRLITSMLALALLATFSVAACGGSSAAPAAVPTPTMPPPSSLVLEEFGLTETHAFNTLGFRMAYPTGWLTGSSGITSLISELREDHDKSWPSKTGNRPMPRATKGYQVSLSVQSKYGFAEHGYSLRTLDQVLGQFDIFYTLSVPNESNVAQMFNGEPALRVTGTMGYGRVVNCIVGHNPELMYLMCIGGPSEQALAEFMPTWEQMLASVEPVD